ncbi:hypothetical protein ACNKHR_18455 [Shigella flexneri]
MINEATLAESIRRLRQGERATLAEAMTLVESRHPRHQALSTQLLDAICRTAVTPCDWALPARRAPEKYLS